MSIKDCLNHLGIEPKQEGTQLVVDCPVCGKAMHCYIDSDTGLWHCKVCDGRGNTYILVKHHKPTATPAEIMETLNQFNLAAETTKQPPKAKNLSWLKDKLRRPTDQEIERLCKTKGVTVAALKYLEPWILKDDPVMLLPGYKPGQSKACGFLRVHLDGLLIKTNAGDKKYPIWGNWSLMGINRAKDTKAIIFAEGWRDALAAINAGYAAVASIGGTGWKADWLSVFKGKLVYVVPDADIPGVKSAKERAAAICGTAKEVRIVNLPYEVKEDKGQDLYDFLSDGGNLAELISKAAIHEAPPPSNRIVLKDDLPSTVAAEFEVQSGVAHTYNSIDAWSIYSDDQYQQVKDDKEIRLYIRKFLNRCYLKKKKKNETYYGKIKKQTSGYVKDILESLAAIPKIHILPSCKAPYSFDPQLDINSTIAMKNGLLDISDAKRPRLLPFTKKFYTFNYLPVNYDPAAIAPEWAKLLEFYFTNDDGTPDKMAQEVLHSWMKRWLLRITEPHKICAIIGEKRSGKSTIGRISCSLIGQPNISSITISSLSGPHGLHALMNKQLGVMWDAKVVGRTGDIAKAVEVMKNISGQDNISVNPKGRDMIDLAAMKLNILMIANEPADLRDSSGALASRFTFLKTTQSFMGQEDSTMENHVIKHELSGILNLILAALTCSAIM